MRKYWRGIHDPDHPIQQTVVIVFFQIEFCQRLSLPVDFENLTSTTIDLRVTRILPSFLPSLTDVPVNYVHGYTPITP